MRDIRLSSVLGRSFRDELERIVFFNPEQALSTGTLVDLVRRYGVPEIIEDHGRLRFRSRGLGLLQTLFALDGTDGAEHLVGVAMFTRRRRRDLVVVHLAVHEDYTSRGRWSSEAVVAQLIAAIRKSALRTRGVKSLVILYPHEIRFDLHSGRET
jgi:hypothetical protein